MDRLLQRERARLRRRAASPHQAGHLPERHQIAVTPSRTGDEPQPMSFELDLVAHDNGTASGDDCLHGATLAALSVGRAAMLANGPRVPTRLESEAPGT